ncbi:MAG: hypothetical protein DMF80_11675 [Acidobacteria bacterium]|nr:MAG: hypothetical protein DMF80_11675 [Acidobacteriota bacterium]PYQ21859.1 MAG: hypothetical protein DMF81_14070 [Acidobacteriota bacterium]
MKRSASFLTLVLGAAVAMQHIACGLDAASPSDLPDVAGGDRHAIVASSQSSAFDFCAAYPTGSAGCQLCGHEDLSLDPGQEHVTFVDLSGCAGEVTFGHFSVVEYIRGGSQVQSLSLRQGGDDYQMDVRNATTGEAAAGALVVDPTYTYFANVPDPVVLKLALRRSPASRGGRKNLAVVFSSWLSH